MAIALVDRIFRKSPRTAGQGYFEHLRFAWAFGSVMLRGALAAFAHGLVPCFLTVNASNRVRELYARIGERPTAGPITPS
jgi:Family of unknown function (DUF6356)